MYLREMGTVALLNREGEIELARRIEHGQRLVMRALSRSPYVMGELIDLAVDVQQERIPLRDVLSIPDLMTADEENDQHKTEFLESIAGIERHLKKLHQMRVKLSATPRSTKPKQYARCGGKWRARWWRSRGRSARFSFPRRCTGG